MRPVPGFVFCVAMIATVFAVDQWTKQYVLRLENKGVLPVQKGILLLIILRNPGAAYGFLQRKQKLLKVIVTGATIGVIFYLIMAVLREKPTAETVSLCFIAGGALGNLADRIRWGYVIDFMYIRIKKLPVFNAADVFIFFGGVLWLVNNSIFV